MCEKSQSLNSRFQKLLKYSPSVVFSFTFEDNLEINFISENIKNILGYEPDKFINDPQSWFDYVHPDDLPYLTSQFPLLLEKGYIVSEYRFMHEDGTYRWLRDEKRVLYDLDSRPKEIIGSWIDFTEQKKTEYMLKESEKKYRDLTEQSLIGFAIIQDNVFKYVNERYAEIGGYTVEEMINWLPGEFSKIVYPDDREMVMDQSIKKQRGDTDVINQYMFRALTKTGEIIWIELYSKTIPYEGRPAVMVTIIDISGRKQAEQKLKESEEKYRKAYEIADFYKNLFAHDINNILNNISISSQLCSMYLATQEDQDEMKKYMIIINEEIKRGANLISNVVKLSELKESEMPIHSTELCNLLKQSIELFKKTFQSRDINIQIDSITEKIFVQANDLLKDVCRNILDNALRYNENPIVDIFVKISKAQKEGQDYIKMEFTDNGIGISDTKKEFIFKRGHMEYKGGKGMGFGLSLVEKIIDSYNGQVWVEDRVKGDHTKGSNFVLLIPESL